MLKKRISHVFSLLHPGRRKLVLDYPVSFEPRYGFGKPAHFKLLSIIQSHQQNYEAGIQQVLGYLPELGSIRRMGAEQDPTQPVWNNGYLPGLDIAALYTFIRQYRPARYVEVGSGNSTKVFARAVRDINAVAPGYAPYSVSIDPAPRAEMDSLVSKVIRKPFEQLGDYSLLTDCTAGDMVFVDNSHRVLPNSDAMVFFMEVLPELKPGVIVHIHDVYLPYDYPQFMCDRFYSEQYALAFFLLANPDRYEVLFPAYYISEQPALAGQLAPLWSLPNLDGVEQHGGSFWFRVR